MLTECTRTLKEAGKTTEVLQTPDGSRLVLLPYGARVLGLFAPGQDESFYWSNPALAAVDSARALFVSAGWHNTGGDRTWIAPEIDTFFPDAEGTRYVQPRQLDMSDYAVEPVGGGVALSKRMTLHLARPDQDIDLRLAKWLGPAPNPLRRERDLAAVVAATAYAGYTQRTTLELAGHSVGAGVSLGIWNLIQLAPGGELLVPTYSRAEVQSCFGAMPAEAFRIESRLLRLKVDFSGSHKIALRAAALCGRAGYLHAQAGAWSLVIRNFAVNPSGEYADVQRFAPEDSGYAFQACRVDEPEFGSFFELEYHAPALGAPPDPNRSDDTSQVWAFRGDRAAIEQIAGKLLGAM